MAKALLLSVFVSLGCLLNAQTLEIIANGNLRSGPGTTNEIIGKVSTGTKVTQIDISGEWHKVELSNKSTGWVHKSLIKSEKPGKPGIQQNRDTIQLAVNAIAVEMRGLIQRHMKNEFFRVPIDISSTYPLEISLAHKMNENTIISGSVGNMSFKGNITIKSNKGFIVYAYPITEIGKDESSRPALMLNSPLTIKDYNSSESGSQSNIMMFTTSGSSINSDNSVQCIKSGNFECSGNYFLDDTIPMYFESGTLIFTDNNLPCTFAEGSTFLFNSVVYKYENSKWVKQ